MAETNNSTYSNIAGIKILNVESGSDVCKEKINACVSEVYLCNYAKSLTD